MLINALFVTARYQMSLYGGNGLLCVHRGHEGTGSNIKMSEEIEW